MKLDWLLRLREWKKDMFVQTQNRLVLQYCALIMIFLVLFISTVYFLVNAVLSFDQERQLSINTEQAVNSIRDSLQDGVFDREDLIYLQSTLESANQSFFYVVNANGQLLVGNTFIPRIQKNILQQLQGWVPKRHEIRKVGMRLPPPPQRTDRRPPPGDREVELMVTGQAIYQGDQLVAIYYTGKEVSFLNELVYRILTILIVLGFVFLVIAVFLSYYMSKRAMVPIRNSFQRQREFVADASHELRTPLSVLHSSLDVLEIEEEDHLSDFSRKTLFNMKDEVKRMTNLVSDLLTLARSDTGHPELKMDYFDIIPSIEQLLQTTQPLALSKGLTIHLQSPASILLHGDQERVKQLLYILLDNAMKYTPKGGKINVTLDAAEVGKHPALRIIVQDTGVGIPADEQQRIFERFYRVDKTRTRQHGGTGLGLAIAKWIVDAHHGTISVESQPDQGSTFTVTLPLLNPKGK
ncbi:sensor histidine kinase [Brevibacillus sp. SYSU BS000544]|uniref:sensor histidine kinase n=1 Tax=Brevibacillus sp. SYSU BS000544 TaxID=3416443 RepID=UPI003CE4AAD7